MSRTARTDLIRVFRLMNEPGGLGLGCTPAGVSLAGVPLLRMTQAGFVPRPVSEIASLLKAAYGNRPVALQSRLGAIAQALNNGDFALAAIAAVQTQTPELSAEDALRLASANEELNKYNYNPQEPRDWHGRWTTDGSASPGNPTSLESDQRAGLDPGRDVIENASSPAAAILPDGKAGDDAEGLEDGVDSGGPTSLEQTFERKYDNLGPVDFAKEVIQFGDWLGRGGNNLPSTETEHALAEYSFLQNRLSFWLAYDYKPAMAQANLLSAALVLYQGAINGGIIRVGNLPQSMLDAAGTAAVFMDSPPRFRLSTIPTAETELSVLAEELREIEGLGGIVDRGQANIEWNKGINAQGDEFETYIEKQIPGVEQLPPNATTFDLVNPTLGEAISAKTLNTLSVGYIKNPQRIFGQVADYVDAALDYEPRTSFDLDPENILSKTIQLAIPEYTSPTQWRYLLRAIIYGKENGVSVVVTRIRE
jgi:hypothetical protein